MAQTAHLDTFARDNLPPREQWPDFSFGLPELQYPDRFNCAAVLVDDAVSQGHGDRPAVRAPGVEWSYEELRDRSSRIASVLRHDMALVPGNRVLLRSANNPMLAACWLGVVKAGGIAVTTMPLLRSREIGAVLDRARISHALCDARLLDELHAATSEREQPVTTACFGGDGELERMMAAHDGTFESVDTAADDVCLLAFTSGTTGQPKATIHFHRDVLAMADTFARHVLETRPGDVYLGSPPLGFTFGLGAMLVFPLRFRATSALVETPTPDALLRAIEELGATCLFTAPTGYRALLPRLEGTDLSSLRQCVSAGETLPRATSDAWFDATGIRIIDGIGTTEMIHIFISAAADRIRPGSTGLPVPGYEACVLDDAGSPLPRGHAGRLAVKGPTGCRYLDDPRQADYVVNGWNVTGDRYRVDEDGYFWFEARADDMIISAGYNIAGPEVEGALLGHPAVAECAVVASPDEERGNLVKAFVVLRDGHAGSDALAKELQDHVKGVIAPYKYPRAIAWTDSLPKTQTGKIQRFRLRAAEGIATPAVADE